MDEKPFIKLDQGKHQYHLIPIGALRKLTEVLMYGAKKYAPNNWRKASGSADMDRYFDACLRHLFAFRDGEFRDPESGLEHLAHAFCNVMFLLELEKENGKESEDKGSNRGEGSSPSVSGTWGSGEAWTTTDPGRRG